MMKTFTCNQAFRAIFISIAEHKKNSLSVFNKRERKIHMVFGATHEIVHYKKTEIKSKYNVKLASQFY